MMRDKIYNAAVANFGKHLTLDPSVPFDVGCAEAVSTVLQQADIVSIPQRGFAGTWDLWQWLKYNKQFVQTTGPEYGGVVMSPTGTSTQGGDVHGHVGIILKKGIASNDSSNGMFNENYSFDAWVHSFHDVKGFPVYYYAPAC